MGSMKTPITDHKHLGQSCSFCLFCIIKEQVKMIKAFLIEGSNTIFHSLTFSREVLKIEGVAGGFQTSRGTLRMLMNDKIIFDRYYCINSTKTL